MRWCRSISMRGMSPARPSDLPRRWPAWLCHPLPDRPACIVMWYSAPVAEELSEGYKGVQHSDLASTTGERWDVPP